MVLMRVRDLSAAVALVVCTAAHLSAQAEGTRVLDAVKQGDRIALTRLIAARSDVNAAEADGTTPLHWAVRADRFDLVQALLQAGAQAGAVNRYGVAPLALAATNGHAGIIQALLDAGASASTASAEGESVLMTAARTGRPDAVTLLLDRGADVNAREGWQSETALMWAAGEDQAEVVRLLAARGADLNARSKALEFPKVKVDLATMVTTALPRGGLTPLMFAARQGAHGAAQALAEVGADLNAVDPDGTTALVLAIINAHYDVAALLVEKGADPNRGDAAGMAALYAAVDMQHQEGLINRPLPKASGRLGAVDVIRALLDRGANPNLGLKTPLLMRQHNGGDFALGEGATPLMRAAKVSDLMLMRLLFDKGADPRARMKNQTTALMVAAARSGRNAPPEAATIDAIRLCLERGADVTASNDSGETALHVAVGRGDTLVRFLVEKGARMDVMDTFGRTPLDVALGAPGRGGRGGAPAERGLVRESTAALLRDLMAVLPTAGR
jgi:uncharacterized protein